MRQSVFLLLLTWVAYPAEVHTLTLKECIDLALKQNPDVVLARLEESKAEQSVRLARAPFVPKVIIGSGLAYSNGIPMSVEGASPTIVQATAISDIFNRSQSFQVAAAKESRRGTALDAAAKLDQVRLRTAELFLDADRAGKIVDLTRREVDARSGVLDSVRARVAEGRELPIETRRAELNLARARYQAQVSEDNVRAARTALAVVVGLDVGDQVQPSQAERQPVEIPESADLAVQKALESSNELRGLQSKLLAKGYDIKAQRAQRWPRVDLVAQYGMLSRINNYDQFFRKFQRNNGQIGMSFQWPVFSGPGVDAAASLAEVEAAQLRIQLQNTRNRIAADTRAAYQGIEQTESARKVAQLDLEVAREQVSVLLAQMQEGRAALRQVEDARSAETDKWIAFYDTAASLEKSRLALLRLTGGLAAALD